MADVKRHRFVVAGVVVEGETMPTAADFLERLARKFESAAAAGRDLVDIRSGDLHAELGGYPSNNHRMPTCCQVMWNAKGRHDEVLQSPCSGRGANLLIRYRIPR